MSEVRPLRHLASIRVSNVDKKSVEGQVPVRLCNYTDVYYGDRITPELDLMAATATTDQVNAFRLLRGDVIITKDSEDASDIGVPAFVADSAPDLVCGYHLAILRPATGCTVGRYLYWAMASAAVQDHLSISATGITRYGLRTDSIAGAPIPWWPPETQRAIAGFLDAETARIDALIAKKRRLIELISERVKVEQAEVASGRTLGAPVCKSGLSWLGSIPVNWRVERLKYVARLETGHTPSRTRPELWENCTTPWVTLNDVGYLESHEFVERTVNLISAEGLAASSARVLPEGTVILSRDATVGRCGVLAEPMATSQHFVNWVCGETLQPRFLWLLFRTVMQKHFDSLTAGATLRTIGMPDVKGFVVPVPSAEDQARIIREAEVARLASRRTTDALTRQIDLLVEHRQALITAAVTGELAVPGVAA